MPTLDACDPPRSASTSTCRSARRAAATATSTPTRRPSWRAPARRRTAGSTAVRRELELAAAHGRARGRSTRCSSAAARRRCSAPPGWRRCWTRSGRRSGWPPGAEVTTESNPESTSPEFFAELVEAGFTRVSLGMQSAAPHVLAVLDRRHTPGRAVAAAREARAAGIAHVNLDLIYATPGETDDDLRGLAGRRARGRGRPRLGVRADRRGRHRAGPPGGPRRAARPGRRRGRRPLRADRRPALPRPVSRWYEVSNWAASDAARVPAQPAATGSTATGGGSARARTRHLAGRRWWNVKHPARYAAALAAGESPAAGREELTAAERHTERVMLRLRLASRAAAGRCWTTPGGRRPSGRADGRAARPGVLAGGRAVLTLRGRLLADRVVHALLAATPA